MSEVPYGQAKEAVEKVGPEPRVEGQAVRFELGGA